MGFGNPSQTWPRYTVGTYALGEDVAGAVTLDASPPLNEIVRVVLLDDLRCLERGKVLEIPRHEFLPKQSQEDL